MNKDKQEIDFQNYKNKSVISFNRNFNAMHKYDYFSGVP